MENVKNKTVSVDLSDLYQFMISECRYGYTRNNHLMPWGAFNHVYEYLPLMVKVDPDWAVSTATQLAEEAISELHSYSFNEDKNKAEIFYEKNGEKDSLKAKWVSGINRYSVDYNFKVAGNMVFRVPTVFKLNDEEASQQIILEISNKNNGKYFVRRSSCHGYNISLFEPDPAREGWFKNVAYNYSMLSNDSMEVDEGHEFLLTVSKEDQLDVADYYKFIRYCLKIVKENGGRKPYNYDDFEEFLKEHPDEIAE